MGFAGVELFGGDIRRLNDAEFRGHWQSVTIPDTVNPPVARDGRYRTENAIVSSKGYVFAIYNRDTNSARKGDSDQSTESVG